MRGSVIAVMACGLIAPAQAMADTPREILTTAAFQTTDKAAALALITRAIAAADGILAKSPGDHEATLQRGIGIGYRAKLTKSRTDAQTSLKIFEALAAKDPRDAEAQMVVAGWHLDAIDQLGGFIARTVLGARKTVGDAALDRAVALGRGRAFFPGLAAMMTIRQDSDDVSSARTLAEAAIAAPATTPLDQLMKRNAAAILPALRAGKGKAAADLSRTLLPFGRLKG
ncbi:MAG TPA: hypothetical protein VF509_04300 [Sphingobium sp.]